MPQIRIDVVCAVPQIFTSVLTSSIISRAIAKGVCEIYVHDLHDYAPDRFKHIDDTPYGGGAGMIFQCQPVFDCIEKLKDEREYDELIYLTPDGKTLEQSTVNSLSISKNLLLLCGHYKGIDQRIRDLLITKEISIGDYVLSGGELPACVLIDSIVRIIPGAISDAESALEDSFQNDLLDAPYYTRPAEFRGVSVPEVLLSGNHASIKKWRSEQSIEKTKTRRPDLFKKYRDNQ